MIDKRIASMREALTDVAPGSAVMIGGFGSSGIPFELIEALRQHGAGDLTIISNNAGVAEEGIAALPRSPGAQGGLQLPAFQARSGSSACSKKRDRTGADPRTFAERMRAAGAGLGGFFTPTGYGTKMAEGKETREIDGRGYVLEHPLSADFALVRAHKGDRWGNLAYNTAGRNFNPVMAMAAEVTVAEVEHLVELGDLNPESVATPGVFVNRVVAQEGMK